MENFHVLRENLQKLEALAELYEELASRGYPAKEDMETARLKMLLIKKEILLLTCLINKNIEVTEPENA